VVCIVINTTLNANVYYSILMDYDEWENALVQREVEVKKYNGGFMALAFLKGKSTTMFSRRTIHTNIELFIIHKPAYQTQSQGLSGTQIDFNTRDTLGVYIDKQHGIQSSTTRINSITEKKHDVLCVPLNETELNKVIEFLHSVQNSTYNQWDVMLSATATLIPFISVPDVEILDGHNIGHSITSIHPPQLVALLTKHCLDRLSPVAARLWGFNSRLINADEIYEQLRGTCMAVHGNKFREGLLITQNGHFQN
jgi:hypothetical protein